MTRPPNLLILWTDEQRHDTLAIGGNRQIHMPALNRLADTATAFTQAHCTQPVCTPSRGCILTGLFPHGHGAVDNNIPLHPHVPTLAEHLPRDRYATAYMGKWHLGDELFAQHGWDTWVSVEDNYNDHFSPGRDKNTRSSYHHWLTARGRTPRNGSIFGRGETAQLPEELGKPAFLSEQATAYIREHRDTPFALSVNFLEPHMPFFGPRDDQYTPADIPLPANWDMPPTAEQPQRLRLKQRIYATTGYEGNPLKTAADWQAMTAKYWGLCSLIDTHIGRILQTLREEGLYDDTLIVFTSDHGDQMSSHRLIAKSVMFAESTRIPLVIKTPGQTPAQAQVVDRRVSQIDLLPTLLDTLGLPIPANLHGVSRKTWLEGRGEATGAGLEGDDVHLVWGGDCMIGERLAKGDWPTAFAEIADTDRARQLGTDQSRTVITQDGWRFTWSTDDLNELYDLNTDPGETKNLAAHPKHAARVADLAARIQAWQTNTKDPLILPDAQAGPIDGFHAH